MPWSPFLRPRVRKDLCHTGASGVGTRTAETPNGSSRGNGICLRLAHVLHAFGICSVLCNLNSSDPQLHTSASHESRWRSWISWLTSCEASQVVEMAEEEIPTAGGGQNTTPSGRIVPTPRLEMEEMLGPCVSFGMLHGFECAAGSDLKN